ncbi:hypothetical protein ACFL52_02480 [Candidatus Margulisiibacteriota bacterium]
MGTKTVGEVSARLLKELYKKNKMIFGIEDAIAAIGSNYNTTKKLLLDMTARNLLMRIKSGRYIVIPEGINGPYIGNWYAAAREISNSPDYFISHYSAMSVHNMLTQPLTRVYISSPKRQQSPKNFVDRFQFVYVKKGKIWGIEENWVTNTEKVRVSDLERTILDCLWQPHNAGGIAEIAKGIWIKKDEIDDNKLLKYVAKYNKKVIAKRLGFILESIAIGDNIIKDLKQYVNKRYDILDPSLPVTEPFKNNWFLLANVNPDEIGNIIRT